MRKLHDTISSRIHHLIAAYVAESAERIKHCFSFEPLEGYAEALRMLETLFGNPRIISNISIRRLIKVPSIRFLDCRGLLKLSEDMRACSCILSNLEAFVELNSPNVINVMLMFTLEKSTPPLRIYNLWHSISINDYGNSVVYEVHKLVICKTLLRMKISSEAMNEDQTRKLLIRQRTVHKPYTWFFS